MECETAAPYPDPALQVPINASHVCYLATANRIDTLPPPLLDRMRMLRFPTARAEDLDSLLPVVVDELARERGLNSRWIAALTVAEREALAAHWRGGSVRRLARRQRRAHAALPSCGEGSEEYAVAARAAASASRPMKPSARSSRASIPEMAFQREIRCLAEAARNAQARFTRLTGCVGAKVFGRGDARRQSFA